MTEQELLKAIQSDDTDQIMLAALQSKLDSELERSDDELDIDKINRITATIDIITGNDRITAERSQPGIDKIKQELHQQSRHSRIRIIKWAAACACFLLIVSNIWSFSAYGMNSFSVAYQILTGGVTIDFSKQESEAKENGNPYEAEMRTAYDKHQIEGLVPAYIPSGFQPTDSFGSSYNMENETHLFFNMKNQKKKLNILVVKFRNLNSIPPLGIASDQLNITEQNINGTIVYISKENQQYTAVFMIDTTQYILSADGVDYDECQRVLESMFE